MKALQSILGHAQNAVTADLYSHVLPNTKAMEIDKLSLLFAADNEVPGNEKVRQR